VQQPRVVIGLGKVGSAVAANYLRGCLNGGTTENTHSEMSGEGALLVPRDTLLLPDYSPSDEGFPAAADEDCSMQLATAAEDFLQSDMPDIGLLIAELDVEAIKGQSEVPSHVRLHEMNGREDDADAKGNIESQIDDILLSNILGSDPRFLQQ
jgi:hypothetical protein